MELETKKLTIDLLEDWLGYFDNDAFSDNDKWTGCYCMCYHWNEALESKKHWDCSKADAAYNRECAVELIKQGIMQGYLAYLDGKVVGWCNANDKQAYDSVNWDFSCEESEKVKKIKSIVCFCISPNFRDRGIASRLLDKVCSDATDDGYEYVEAYPFVKDEYNYHGSKSMYEKNGFTVCGNDSGCTIVRKYL
jgi:ribosomal protein S18 acetylase RimI-like enzyme